MDAPTRPPKPAGATLETAMASGKNHFDFLRLFFAVLVLYSHCFVLVQNGSTYPDVLNWTRGQSYPAEIAVNAFFLISGFLITMSWTRSKGLGPFLKKRVLRIYPGFVAACLFCGLVVAPLGSQSVSVYYADLAKSSVGFLIHVLTLDKLHLPPTFINHPAASVNGSLWTIRIEFECYLLVPVLAALGAVRRPAMVLGLAAVCWIGYAALLLGGSAYLAGRMPGSGLPGSLTEHSRFVTYYLAGMVFYLFRNRIALDAKGVWVCAAALAASAVWGGFNVVMPLAGSYLIMQFAFNQTLRGVPNFGKNLDLSYGVYLYAWPVKQLIIALLGAALNPYLLFVMALPATLLLAAASWYGVERPFLRLRESNPKRRAASAAELAGVVAPN